MNIIGQAVRFHRNQNGLSRVQLAEKAGVGKTLIYDIEHGKESIQFSGLKKVLGALKIEILLESPLMELFKSREAGDGETDVLMHVAHQAGTKEKIRI